MKTHKSTRICHYQHNNTATAPCSFRIIDDSVLKLQTAVILIWRSRGRLYATSVRDARALRQPADDSPQKPPARPRLYRRLPYDDCFRLSAIIILVITGCGPVSKLRNEPVAEPLPATGDTFAWKKKLRAINSVTNASEIAICRLRRIRRVSDLQSAHGLNISTLGIFIADGQLELRALGIGPMRDEDR
ncbi:hypothetical protein EVAR_2789_1 [Eumeta japonica]|uniref:Uncharacterized protein n=1 Tax=Eumeta variegata TaxID=151549 RepID=A0A4C1SZI3_EUMVA|nr:hypothetical protein EVAR_2789_1 [Eumeta japonica]